jgi:hypothetical protein
MGWFTRDEPEEIVFEEVVDTDGQIWPAFTDHDGVLWIDVDDDVEVVVNGATPIQSGPSRSSRLPGWSAGGRWLPPRYRSTSCRNWPAPT